MQESEFKIRGKSESVLNRILSLWTRQPHFAFGACLLAVPTPAPRCISALILN